MAHAGTDKGPAQGLVRCRDKHVAFGGAQMAAGCFREAFGVQLGLLGQPAIEESPDFEIALNRLFALLLAALGGDCFRHQRVELGVPHLLHPVMAQQALELRIERLVVLHAVEEMTLRHPFDMQDEQRHRERMMRQHLAADRVGRTDHVACGAEAAVEFLAEFPEQLNVLCFLGGKAEERADPVVVMVQLRPHMVEHERKDKLLDQPEHVQIAGSADLVRDAALLGREPRHGLGAGI